MRPARDLSGQRFGRLVAIERTSATRTCGQKYSLWHCRCDCGNTKNVSLRCLADGHTLSCGCLQSELLRGRNTTHGKTYGSRTYNAWRGMRRRCSVTKRNPERGYAGRGITVCKRWNKFENFYADMGEAPLGMSIDRKDNSGNYEPTNCRWATATEQQNNRRTNRWITVNDKTLTLAQWSRETGIHVATLSTRLRHGWPLQDVFGLKVKSFNRRVV